MRANVIASMVDGMQARAAQAVPGLESPGGGAMVALYPANPEEFAEPDGLNAEDMHVTLRFLGRASELEEGMQEHLVQALSGFAQEFPRIRVGMDWQIAHFGGPDVRDAGYVAVVAEWPHDDETLNLIMAHDQVSDILDEIGAEDASSFRDQAWRAHMTLGYYPIEEAEERFPEGSGWPHEPLFDRLVVKFADEAISLALEG